MKQFLKSLAPLLCMLLMFCLFFLLYGCSSLERQVDNASEQIRSISADIRGSDAALPEAMPAAAETSTSQNALSNTGDSTIGQDEERLPTSALQMYLEQKDIWLPADTTEDISCWLTDLDSDGIDELFVTEYHESVPYTAVYGLEDNVLYGYSCEPLTDNLLGFALLEDSLQKCERDNNSFWLLDADIALLDGTIGSGLIKLDVHKTELGTVLKLTVLALKADGVYYIDIDGSLAAADQTLWEDFQSSLTEGVQAEITFISREELGLQTPSVPASAKNDSMAVSSCGTAAYNDSAEPVSISVDTADLVTDAFSADVCNQTFHIPQINLNSDAVSDINAEIWDCLYDGNTADFISAADLIKLIEDQSDIWAREPTKAQMMYEWYLNGDVLSLIIGRYTEELSDSFSDCNYYYVYNVSVSTGERVSDEELIALIGLSPTEYDSLIRLAIADRNAIPEDEVTREEIQSCPLYFDENGQLCIIAPMHVSIYYYFVELNLNNYILDLKASQQNDEQESGGRLPNACSSYTEVLEGYSEENSSDILGERQYLLYDIDENGTPELFVFEWPAVTYANCHVYSFDGNNVVDCGTISGSRIKLYAYQGNGLVVCRGGDGMMTIDGYTVYSVVWDADLYVLTNNIVTLDSQKANTTNGWDDYDAYLANLTLIDDYYPITDLSYLHD